MNCFFRKISNFQLKLLTARCQIAIVYALYKHKSNTCIHIRPDVWYGLECVSHQAAQCHICLGHESVLTR